MAKTAQNRKASSDLAEEGQVLPGMEGAFAGAMAGAQRAPRHQASGRWMAYRP